MKNDVNRIGETEHNGTNQQACPMSLHCVWVSSTKKSTFEYFAAMIRLPISVKIATALFKQLIAPSHQNRSDKS